jgi:hypothetical protein
LRQILTDINSHVATEINMLLVMVGEPDGHSWLMRHCNQTKQVPKKRRNGETRVPIEEKIVFIYLGWFLMNVKNQILALERQ